MIFITERGWNAPIPKVIPGVSDSYRSAPKTKQLKVKTPERKLQLVWDKIRFALKKYVK